LSTKFLLGLRSGFYVALSFTHINNASSLGDCHTTGAGGDSGGGNNSHAAIFKTARATAATTTAKDIQ